MKGNQLKTVPSQRELEEGYREYLKDTVLDDADFDITTTEDFWTWREAELERLNEEE
jgi:hypothetical protein